MSTAKIISLSIMERLTLVTILPKETNYGEFVVKTDLTKKLLFTQKEMEDHGIAFEKNGDCTMTVEAAKIKSDIEFTKLEFDMASKQLRDQERDRKLTDATGPLYEKFCK